MSLLAGCFPFCISLPNEFWELCAVVITTRCQLGNLYANGIGLGLISLPIPQDLVAMGMPNFSLSNLYFLFFCFKDLGHRSFSLPELLRDITTGVKKISRSEREEL